MNVTPDTIAIASAVASAGGSVAYAIAKVGYRLVERLSVHVGALVKWAGAMEGHAAGVAAQMAEVNQRLERLEHAAAQANTVPVTPIRRAARAGA